MNSRRALERLRAKAVLRMEMRERQDQRPLAGELPRAIQHFLAVDRAHPGIHHECGVAAENDADIRHQRNAPVGNDIDAGGFPSGRSDRHVAREARCSKHHSLRRLSL